MTQPKVGKWVLRGGGWSTQALQFSRTNPSAKGGVVSKGLQRGYVKLRNPQGVVVDRALTVTAAIKRIKHLKTQGTPL